MNFRPTKSRRVAHAALALSLPGLLVFGCQAPGAIAPESTGAAAQGAGTEAAAPVTEAMNAEGTEGEAAFYKRNNGKGGASAAPTPAPSTETDAALATLTATASNTRLSTLGASRTVDGDLNTDWQSGTVSNPWLRLDRGASSGVASLVVRGKPAIGTFNVEVSTDNVTYKTVLSNQTLSSWNAETKTFPAGTSARYVRLRFANSSQNVLIYEVTPKASTTTTSPSPSPTTSPSASPTPAPSATPTPAPTATPTPSPSATPTPSPTSYPAAIYNGGFESGNYNGYMVASHNFVGASQPTLVTDRVRDGRYAAKFSISSGGQRTELTPTGNDITHFTEGEDLYFGFSLYFDPSWPTASNWNIVTQWKQDGDGTPPLQLSAEGDKLQLRGRQYATGTNKAVNVGTTGIPRGKWSDFVVHVKFSTNSSIGFIEAWRDGVKVVNKTPWQTMVAGRSFNYWKMGIYRDTATPGSTSIWNDGWRIGTSYESVVPRK